MGKKKRTNNLNGQNPNTMVGPFQRQVEANGQGPRESQNKSNRKQAGDDNAFLETRCDIKVSEARDRMPALDISAGRHPVESSVDGSVSQVVFLSLTNLQELTSANCL